MTSLASLELTKRQLEHAKGIVAAVK
ncbi:MAG: hypothetical protein QOF92_2119, partial [Pseudonocardiales bacterium]|nr:hypothetical protein [Pseudonocardiales bacterium]